MSKVITAIIALIAITGMAWFWYWTKRTEPTVRGDTLTLNPGEVLVKIQSPMQYQRFDGHYPGSWPPLFLLPKDSFTVKGLIHSRPGNSTDTVSFRLRLSTLAIQHSSYNSERRRVRDLLGRLQATDQTGSTNENKDYVHYDGKFVQGTKEIHYVIRVWKMLSPDWSATSYFFDVK